MSTMSNSLRDAIVLAGRISAMQDSLAAMLNCKASDCNKVIAAMMQAENLVTATAVHAGRTYSATVRAAGADSEVFDSDKAKALLLAAGIALPTKMRKGAAATAIIK